MDKMHNGIIWTLTNVQYVISKTLYPLESGMRKVECQGEAGVIHIMGRSGYVVMQGTKEGSMYVL